MIKTFLENGGTPEMTKSMLRVTDEQISAALKPKVPSFYTKD